MALPGESAAFADRRNRFALALFLSLLLHGLLLLTLQDIEIPEDVQSALPFIAELRPAPAPATPPKPAPKPAATPSPKKADKPSPKPVVKEIVAAPPASATAPVVSESASKVESPSPAQADSAPPASSPSSGNAEKFDQALVGRYDIAIACAMKRYRQYPFQARRNEWSGTVRMQLHIGSNGQMREVRVVGSSGYRLLDDDAAETLRKAQADVPVPQRLLGHEFHVDQALTYDMSGLDQGPTPTVCPKP